MAKANPLIDTLRSMQSKRVENDGWMSVVEIAGELKVSITIARGMLKEAHKAGRVMVSRQPRVAMDGVFRGVPVYKISK